MINLNNKNLQAYCLGFVIEGNEKNFIVAPLTTTTHNKLFFESEETALKYVSNIQKHPQIFNGFNISQNNYKIEYFIDEKKQEICCGIDAILLPPKTINFLNYVEKSNNLLNLINKLNNENMSALVYDNINSCFVTNNNLKTHFIELDLNTSITSGIYKNVIANVNDLNGVPTPIINKIN